MATSYCVTSRKHSDKKRLNLAGEFLQGPALEVATVLSPMLRQLTAHRMNIQCRNMYAVISRRLRTEAEKLCENNNYEKTKTMSVSNLTD